MRYYIAHPAPLNSIVNEISDYIGYPVEISKENNQVGIVECDLTVDELEELLDFHQMIIINDNLEEWGI